MTSFPHRWIVCALCSLSLALLGYKNYCFHAIDSIIDSATERKRKPSSDGCHFLFSNSTWDRRELPLTLPELLWNSDVLHAADSAFMTGKLLMCVPAGVLSDVGYSRYTLLGGMLLVVSHLFLLSAFIKSGVTMFVMIHYFDGVGEALIYTSVYTMMSRWAPPSQRNLFTALVVSGIIYGDTAGHVLFKWTYIQFRSWTVGQIITGVFGLIWISLGYVFIHTPYKSPFKHPIETISTTTIYGRRTFSQGLIRLKEIPWKIIAQSRPLLALTFVFCSVNWIAFSNIWKAFRDYQKDILRLPEVFSDEATAMAVAVVPASLFAGYLADWLNQENFMSKTLVKKSFAFVGVLSSSVLQTSAAMVGCNIVLFWVLFVSSAFALGLAHPAVYSTPIDLSPRHAGLVMGIIYGVRTACALIKKKVDDKVITDRYSLTQWRNVIVFNSALSLVLLVPFLVFGSGEPQRWGAQRKVVRRSGIEEQTGEEESVSQVLGSLASQTSSSSTTTTTTTSVSKRRKWFWW